MEEIEWEECRLEPGHAPELESEAAPFARDTIWYQPAPIQRRARQLLEKLERPQFLELVGISALANMLCRLDAIVQDAVVR
jgi:hypothetical protein